MGITQIRIGQITSGSAGENYSVVSDGVGGLKYMFISGSGGSSGSGGDVYGPASATDGHMAVFDGGTGKHIRDGGAVPTAGHGIQSSGSSVPQRTYMNIIGATVEDDSGNNATKITISSSGSGGGDPGEGHITGLCWNWNSIGQGDWTTSMNTSSIMAAYYSQATPANADEISYKVYLAAGTYSFNLVYHKNTTGGIMDIYIDATEIGSIDQYGASLAWNQKYTITGIVVATSGLKTIKFKMDGKNASSSSYKGWIVFFAFWRTA